MTVGFLDAVCGFFESLGFDGVFFIAVGLTVAAFIPLFIGQCVCRGKTKKERTAFVFISAGSIAFETAGNLAIGGVFARELLVLPLINFSLAIFLYVFFVFFGNKEVKVEKEHKEFIKILEKNIKNPDKNQTVPHLENARKSFNSESDDGRTVLSDVTEVKPVAKTKVNAAELDFTHVKNVIERLNYYNLNGAERRLVKDLRYAVSQAESGNVLPETQSEINDGLGAVLKIMAKYGV